MCRSPACIRPSRRTAGPIDGAASPGRRLREVRRAPHSRPAKSRVDSVRSSDSPQAIRGVSSRDCRVPVAVRSAAARSRSRGERRRPDLPQSRQPSRAARPNRTRSRSRPSARASSGWRSRCRHRPTWTRARSIFRFRRRPKTHEIAELVLHTGARVNRFEEKAAFVPLAGLTGFATPPVARRRRACARASVVDLTSKMGRDGTLDWTPPPGKWVVLRMGYSLIGMNNHPASPEGTGLRSGQAESRARQGLHGRRTSTATRAPSAH